MRSKWLIPALVLLGTLGTSSCNQQGPVREAESHKDTRKEAYIYGFPMIMNYGVMYAYAVDRNSGQFKAPFNQTFNEARVFTPRDTAVVTPNSDTPYSMLFMDLRAEPIVLCLPKVEKNRYYSVQLVDMYTFNYGYMGSRATGNDAGCYMVAGPDWKGDAPVLAEDGAAVNFAARRGHVETTSDTSRATAVEQHSRSGPGTQIPAGAASRLSFYAVG